MDTISAIYDYSLQPIAPFTWFGLGISTLDVVGAFRLCIILRQIKEALHVTHSGVAEARSFARSGATVFLVVFGGEVISICDDNDS